VVYVGATPRGTLRRRYEMLARAMHTAFFPILALLLAGWRLEYGYVATESGEEAEELEKSILCRYERIHGGPPALVERRSCRRDPAPGKVARGRTQGR